MWKKLTAIGMAGALVYVLHVIIGGMLWEGYDHLMQPISDLTPRVLRTGYCLNISFGLTACFP